MASLKMPSSSTQQRRKEVTYGKTSRKAPSTFGDAAAPAESPSLSPPTARKRTPGQLKRPQKIASPSPNGAVFDVPSSDDDHDDVSFLRIPKQPSRLSKVPAKAVRGQPSQPHRSKEPTVSPVPSTTSANHSRKRKRTIPSSIVEHYSHSEQDDRRPVLQLRRETHGAPQSQSNRRLSDSSSSVDRAASNLGSRIRTTSSLQSATPEPNPKRRLHTPDIPVISTAQLSTPRASRELSDGMLMSTPPRQTSRLGTPGSTTRGTVTPRQAQRWKELLGDPQTSPIEPDVQPELDSLSLHTLQKPSAVLANRRILPRKRLVDELSLPPSIYNSDAEPKNISSEDEEASIAEEGSSGTSFKAVDVSPEIPPMQPRISNMSGSQSIIPEHGTRITYAKERTVLAEPVLDFEASLQQPLISNSGTSSQKPGMTDQSRDMWLMDDDENSQGGMMNIHELRASGDNRRFKDEIDILLEDLQPGSNISRKRNALLNFATKLTETAYMARFVENGYESQVLELCRNETDVIFGSAMAYAICLILNGPVGTQSASNIYDAGVLRLLTILLEYSRDLMRIAKDRSTNMSRSAQESLAELCAHIKKSPIWTTTLGTVVSPRLLALVSIEHLVRHLRSVGNADSLLDNTLLKAVLSAIPQTSQLDLPNRMPTLSEPEPGYKSLELGLSILQYCTAVPRTGSQVAPWNADDFQQMVVAIEGVLRTSSEEEIRDTAIRLLVNLTNNRLDHWDAVKTSQIVEQLVKSTINSFEASLEPLEPEASEKMVSSLILFLAAMINLAEWNKSAREATVGNNSETLDALVTIFVKRRELAASADSMEESQFNVAYLYLAVLLGNLCQSAEIRARIVAKLPGHRLNVILEAVNVFISLQQTVDSQTAGDRRGDGRSTEVLRKLHVVADSLRAQGA